MKPLTSLLIASLALENRQFSRHFFLLRILYYMPVMFLTVRCCVSQQRGNIPNFQTNTSTASASVCGARCAYRCVISIEP